MRIGGDFLMNGSPKARRGRHGKVLLLLAVALVGSAGAFFFSQKAQASRARQQKEDLDWEDFRAEIERKIARAKRLVDRAATFEAGRALEAARVHRKNGFTYRVLDHLENARLLPRDNDGATTLGGAVFPDIVVDSIRLRRERRPALTLQPGDVLGVSVNLPEERLELTFGLGSDKSRPGGSMKLRMRFGQNNQTVTRPLPSKWETWNPVRIALPDWAHGPGRLEWEIRDEMDLPVYLSEPVIFGAPERRLNVVLILEDTLRADHLSVYGYHRRTSPVKEAFFGKGGVVFENAFAQGPTTLISVPCLMTSLYPSATGVVAHRDRLPKSVLTLAEILRDQGYATGSILQNPYGGRLTGLHQGYERIQEPDRKREWPTSEDIYKSLAPAWLDAFEGRNAFLYLHIMDPHHPYQKKDVFQYAGADRSDTRGGQDDPLVFEGGPDDAKPDSARGKRLQYGGEIRRNDFHFGRFIDQLEERGILQDTLIVFVSDHGEYFGERGMWVHTPPGYRQMTHVPLMMWHPELIPEGRRIETPAQLIDVVPTILDLLEIPKEPFLLSGDSLLPLLDEEQSATVDWNRRLIFSEENEHFGASFVRERWHVLSSTALMWNIDKHKRMPLPQRAWRRLWNSGEQVRVFDMKSDPLELDPERPISRDRAFRKEVIGLRDALMQEYAATHVLLEDQDPEDLDIDPDVLNKLKDLGYI
jgi:arylsulfatase